MAKEKPVYAPGELGKVRGRLGNIDPDEAKRMSRVLGGEVGTERSPEPPPAAKPAPRSRSGGGRPGRPASGNRAAGEGAEGLSRKTPPSLESSPLENTLSYRERVKMDRCMGQIEFDIKTGFQVLRSVFSFAGAPPDYIKPRFVTKHLSDYYQRIETLVSTTRTLCPRSNLKRGEQLKRANPFYARIIDTIRYWNVERYATELSRIQGHPRDVTVIDTTDIVKVVYKPLIILEKLDNEEHIKEAYKLLYKILFVESPVEAKEKFQGMIKEALAAFVIIRKDIQYLLYPLLQKLVSDRCFSYDVFFQEQKERIMAFLGVADSDQILPVSAGAKNGGADLPAGEDENETEEEKTGDEEQDGDTVSEEENDRNVRQENERRAVDRGLKTLESLFPGAGWDRLAEGVDLYPYFQGIFKIRSDYALINPKDSLFQAAVLMYILEGLCVGLRQVKFGMLKTTGSETEDAAETLVPIINNWQYFLDNSFEKEYLPKLSEYCRILENTAESRTSNYARRTYDEARWIKRQYFMPYYRFEASFPQPAQTGNISAVYPEVRSLRRCLTAVAAGIERGNKAGGAANRAVCDGILNPWDRYHFEIPNPVSVRLDAILGAKQKNNATLVFIALAAAIVLDFILNSESSWAYREPGIIPFRSIDGAGVTPQRGVDSRIDADAIFRERLQKMKARAGGAAAKGASTTGGPSSGGLSTSGQST